MSGCRGGVATLLAQVNPHLWYVHCYCHKLNLALVSSCLERQECADCYVTLKDLHNFFSGSVCAAVLKTAKDVRFREYRMDQVDVVEEVQNKIEDSEDSDISEDSDSCCVDDIHPIVAGPKELSGKCKRHFAAVTLKSFSKTRWAYQYRANAAVLLTFTSIVDALISLSEEKRERGTKVRNLLQRCTLAFLFFNGALMELTGKAFVLSTMLQSVDCDLNQAMSLLTILRQALTEACEKLSDIRSI